MSRFLTLGVIAVCAHLACVSAASAGGSKVATAMGDLRWGMSEYEVNRFAKDHLEQHYSRAIQQARSEREKSKLQAELKQRLGALKDGYVSFDGPKTRWDRSAVAGEFTHGNGEGLLVVKDTSSTNYYFFINDELWKWVKFMDADKFGGKNFDKFSKTVQRHFGSGIVKNGARLANVPKKQRWVEFMDRRNRLRAVDQTKRHGAYALVFEDMEAVRQLSALRANTPAGGGGAAAEPDEVVAEKVERKSRPEPAAARKRRSIFADEPEVAARRKRSNPGEDQAKQRRAHERQQRRANKSSALEGVGAMENDDPLAGL